MIGHRRTAANHIAWIASPAFGGMAAEFTYDAANNRGAQVLREGAPGTGTPKTKKVYFGPLEREYSWDTVGGGQGRKMLNVRMLNVETRERQAETEAEE